MPYLQIIGIIIFSLILIKSSSLLSVHLKSLAKRSLIGGFFLTSFIVGLATSLPELFVGVTSALTGVPTISLGNAIGSNIANMTLVAGGAALIGGVIIVKNHDYAEDLLYAFLAAMAPLFLLMDNSLSRVDALILIALYFFYNYAILARRNKEISDNQSNNLLLTLIRKIRHPHNTRDLMIIFLSISIILFSADMIVRFGVQLAEGLNVSPLLVGLIFVAIGTSLPEFVVEFQAIRNRDTALYMGNLLGSIVANGTLIVGITALIHPITVLAFDDYFIATIALVLVFFIFYTFMRTKNAVNRIEGFVLIGLYSIFLLIEFVK